MKAYGPLRAKYFSLAVWLGSVLLISGLLACGGDNLPPGRGQIIPNPARSYQPVSGSAFPATPSPAPPFGATALPQSPFPNTSPFPATPRPAPPF